MFFSLLLLHFWLLSVPSFLGGWLPLGAVYWVPASKHRHTYTSMSLREPPTVDRWFQWVSTSKVIHVGLAEIRAAPIPPPPLLWVVSSWLTLTTINMEPDVRGSI